MLSSRASTSPNLTPEFVCALGLVAVGARPLALGVREQSMWIFKCGAMCVLAGLFALAGVAPLGQTMPLLLKLPLFPLYAEVARGGLGPLWDTVPGLVALWWALGSWIAENVHSGAARDALDSVVMALMWMGLLAAMYSPRCTIVRATSGQPARSPAVLAAASNAAVRALSWLAVPEQGALWCCVGLYATHCTMTLLLAAQADEESRPYSVRHSWVLGMIPLAHWERR